jgi:hypothetical protein
MTRPPVETFHSTVCTRIANQVFAEDIDEKSEALHSTHATQQRFTPCSLDEHRDRAKEICRDLINGILGDDKITNALVRVPEPPTL